jgi:predicted nucleic acid-binding protein
MPCDGRTFCLDASVVITFNKNGQFQLLEDVLAGKAVISQEVYDECVSPRISIDASLATGKFQLLTISDPSDLAFFAQAARQMDRGEASALTIARSIGATLLCNDHEAITIGGSLPAPTPTVEGCAEVLCYAVGHGHLTAQQAEVHLDTFIAGGAWVPMAPTDYFDGCV